MRRHVAELRALVYGEEVDLDGDGEDGDRETAPASSGPVTLDVRAVRLFDQAARRAVGP